MSSLTSTTRLQSEVTDVTVVGYVRVSTDDQDAAPQTTAITNECERRGWHLVAIHEDKLSGKTTAGREGLAAALEAVEDGTASALVVAKLDRLSRSLLDFCAITERARKNGWRLVALDLGVDTATPSGEMMANVLASFAQFERRLIGQRTADALAQKRRQGVQLGRPRIPIPQHVEDRILREHKRGKNLTAIADGLNQDGLLRDGRQWYPTQVSRVLARADEERPGWQAVHQPMPVAQPFPTCDRCNRRAVARIGEEKLCKVHSEQVLRRSA